MKRPFLCCLIMLFLSIACLPAWPQDASKKDEPKTSSARTEGPQLKVQIVFSEYDGDKKIKSLPYTLLVRAESGEPWSKIRMGSRVPVYAGGAPASFQYVDVGTSIDCRASVVDDGRYRLSMNLERSWIEGDVAMSPPKSASSGEPTPTAFPQPIIRQFRSENTVTMRDGQSMETNFATDPVSGKVIRLEVTLNVLK